MADTRVASVEGLRRHVVSSQGFARRFRRADADQVAQAVARLSCVQLDSISTVERSHHLVLTSRAGAFPQDEVSKLLGAGRLFEYWAHEASLLPVEDWPLWRWRMRERRTHHWFGPVLDSDPALARAVLGEIERRGPLGSRHFEGAGGGMWAWKPAKKMLDALWTAGELVIAGRQGFQRLYDLPERVLPRRALDAPEPTLDEALEALALRAVRARGALTERGVLEHWRLDVGREGIRPALASLAKQGLLERVEIEDGGEAAYVPAGADLDPPATSGAVLLSPFENLLWDRAFAARILGFEHLIEVYKPEPQRQYGYYVMPLLMGDRLVGRADVKADRDAGTLRVKRFHREAGVRASSALDDGLASAHARLARILGLQAV